MNDINIRVAAAADAPELLAIYAPYVRDTAISFEYAPPSVEEFEARIAKTLEMYPYLVAELDGEAVGYAYAGPYSGRAAYAWSAETSIYVKTGLHGRGIGRALYAELEKLLKKQGVLTIYAGAAYSAADDEHITRASEAFHAHMGYKEIARFPECGSKFGRWYGIVWLEKRIGKHANNPTPIIPFSELNSRH